MDFGNWIIRTWNRFSKKQQFVILGFSALFLGLVLIAIFSPKLFNDIIMSFFGLIMMVGLIWLLSLMQPKRRERSLDEEIEYRRQIARMEAERDFKHNRRW